MTKIMMAYMLEDETRISKSKAQEKLVKTYKLACKNYGFDYNFVTEEKEIEKIIYEFRKHTIENHFIDYPEGVLMNFINHQREKKFYIG